MRQLFLVAIALVCTTFCANPVGADDPPPRDTSRGDAMIARYFANETEKLATQSLAGIKTLADWEAQRGEYRRQLFEMLGLDPLPEKSPLNVEITGRVDHEAFFVDKLHFQSRPGMYVTGNLYVPKDAKEKLPAILYVCGHANIVKDGISYGSKAHYQHHAGWFARNGYVCLVIDTVQLGEIPGIHHGTYREKMWWWNSRGYSSAGAEAWNCIRALDYLESRPEVDGTRIGVSGRSGGGAYSWWISALDDRIKVSVPVAGITDLHNHVIDGTVEGHCDCMFMVNTYRWDYAQVAALVSPRPLLISNTDKDTIFPLEGVVRLHSKVRDIYRLQEADKALGLLITEGPHNDTQELQIPAFHWFNRFLKKEDPQITITAERLFEPEQLKVFAELPADAINGRIHETFTALAPPPEVPENADAWGTVRDSTLQKLKEKSFRGWPSEEISGDVQPAFSVERDGIQFAAYDFTSQQDIRLRLYLAHRAGLKLAELDLVVLNAFDETGWQSWLATMQPGFKAELADEALPEGDAAEYDSLKKMFASFKWGMAYVCPRGVGPTAWNPAERKQTHHRRRFMLLGQTLAGMQVWDVRRAAQTLRGLEGFGEVPLWMQGEREMSVVTLYASLFEPDVARLDLHQLPESHQEGPDFLNILRVLDLPTTVALAAERSQVRLYPAAAQEWKYPQAVAAKLGWKEKQIQVRVPKAN